MLIQYQVQHYHETVLVQHTTQHVPLINPLSPNSDHHQFSPNNIHMLPREMLMGSNKMITKEKML